MAHAIHVPDPEVAALQQTKAARVIKSDGIVVIGFCVDTRGKTTDVEVVEPFPGDPGVDEILLATVKTWRFEPFLVDGRPMKTCSRKTFSLRFKSTTPPAPAPTQPVEPLAPSRALDVCVHIVDMMSADAPDADISEATIDQFLHRCVGELKAQHQALGEEAFERVAGCILDAENMEAIAACGARAG